MMNELNQAVTVMPFRRRVRRAWTAASAIELVAAAAIMVGTVGECAVAPRVGCMWPETKRDIAKLETQKLVNEAYPQWERMHAAHACPAIADLLPYMDRPHVNDPWGSGYQLNCDADRIRVWSFGEDRVANTSDDIRSWE